MADWSLPALTSTYTNFLTEVKNRDVDLALQFDGTTSTSLPVNTIRWDSSANRWKKWNGSAWVELTGTYALTGLTTTGNLGVGTSSPGAALHVVANLNGDQIRVGTDASIHYRIGRNGNDGLLYFYGSQSGYAGYVFSGANGERLRIDSSGNVGIGTSSPSVSLDVNGRIRLANANRLDWGNGNEFVAGDNGGAIIFGVASAERLRIDSSGNVIINGQGDLRFNDSDNSNWVALQAPATVASNVTWTLPATDGAANQLLKTNGSGQLGWTDGGFPSGTVMLFVQTTAPTGWTKSTTHDNKALRVVSGNAGSGGSTAFTTVFASRTPTGGVSGSNTGGGVQNATITWGQMPSHTHSTPTGLAGSGGDSGFRGGFDGYGSDPASGTGSAGGDQAHGHGYTNPTWSGTFTGNALDFAVAYVDTIIATKA